MLFLPPKLIYPPGTALVQATIPPGRCGRGQSPDGVVGPQPLGKAAPWEHRSPLSPARAPVFGRAAAHLPWTQRVLLRPGNTWQRRHRICSSQQWQKPKLITNKPLQAPFIPVNKYVKGEKALESQRASDLL